MMRKLFGSLLVLALTVIAVGCGDEETVFPTVPAPAATSTRPPGQPATPPPGTPTPLPPVDGTVPAQGFGGTDPVTIKANPDPAGKVATLEDIRIGAHPEEGGWDRIVFEFADVRPAGKVEYVASDTRCGSGDIVAFLGMEMLKITFEGAQAHDDNGRSTIDGPFVSNREVLGPDNSIHGGVVTCDFEGQVGVALRIEGMQRFNVRFLDNPTRVVIDVKWP